MIDSFNDFVSGDDRFERKSSKSTDIKPYIYVLRYIISKDNYFTELKEYIINYSDDQTDYEDGNIYDSFIDKLKELAENNEFAEIEDMIDSYEDFSDDDLDYDENDDDYEEKFYCDDYVDEDENDYMEDENDYMEDEEIEYEVQNSKILSDKLKDFLKLDLQFEDLEEYEYDDEEIIDGNNVIDVKYEEIQDNDPKEEKGIEYEHDKNDEPKEDIEDNYDDIVNEYTNELSEEETEKDEDYITNIETDTKKIVKEEYEKRKKKTPNIKIEQKDMSVDE